MRIPLWGKKDARGGWEGGDWGETKWDSMRARTITWARTCGAPTGRHLRFAYSANNVLRTPPQAFMRPRKTRAALTGASFGPAVKAAAAGGFKRARRKNERRGGLKVKPQPGRLCGPSADLTWSVYSHLNPVSRPSFPPKTAASTCLVFAFNVFKETDWST